jgi:S-adenosylmethionine decarboxylase proenzyme
MYPLGTPRGVPHVLEIVQLLVDCYECAADLDDADFLLATLRGAAERVGAKIVNVVTQRFSPRGVSVILILAETHLSVHTWPEHGYAAVDVFVCGEGKDPHPAWDVIRGALGPGSFEKKEIRRTIGEKRS